MAPRSCLLPGPTPAAGFAERTQAHLELFPPTTSSLGTHVTSRNPGVHAAQLPHFTAGETEAPNPNPNSSEKQEATFSSCL